MNKTYQLTCLVTGKVTMCEKINEHYVIGEEIKEGDYYYNERLDSVFQAIKKTGYNTVDKEYKLIATTNTSLQCPQVVDYVEELANDISSKYSEYHSFYELLPASALIKLREDNINCIKHTYQKHSETHSLSDEEVVEFAKFAVKNRLDMEQFFMPTYDELLQQFKQTIPTKVYYR